MRLQIWVRRSVTVLLLAAACNAGISISLRGQRAHDYLTARLAESFGRPVEVGRFDFSFFDGLRLNAKKITVGEDLRFGHEYFLRAEQLKAGLRWGRFFFGHFEFGTLSFTRPSLNLVRTSDGRWNIENWLPTTKPAAPVPGSRLSRDPAGRLYKIEVDGGRLNFKSGADKRPFALVDVSGSVEQEAPGRWRLDLEAHPMRAGVTLQQSGILRVFGRVAGTSARLQPAELYAKWEDASIADMLRLADGKDYGVRGRLTLDLSVLSQPATAFGWILALNGQAANVHRWDLAARPSDPTLNVTASAVWDPRDPRMKIGSLTVEGPHSQLRGSGEVIWHTEIKPEFEFHTRGIAFADLFGWYRAFQPGVAEQTSLDGYVRGQFGVSGWPPQLDSAEFTSNGATLGAEGLRGPIASGQIAGTFQDGWLRIEPLLIHLPALKANSQGAAVRGATIGKSEEPDASSAEFLKLSARVSQTEKIGTIALEGETRRAEDLLSMMRAIGQPVNQNWTLTGPLKLNFRRTIKIANGKSPMERAMGNSTSEEMIGWVELQDARLRMAGLHMPVELADARLEWKDGERNVLLRSAGGLGAHWTGTLIQQGIAADRPPPPWDLDLSGDHLSAVELIHWLGPAPRGFLERLLPGIAAANVMSANKNAGDQPVNSIRARGHIALEELQVAPLHVRKLQGNVKINGRIVRLEDAEGEFYGGKLHGSFEGDLNALPEYRVNATIERVNLSALVGATTTLRERFGGFASGRIHLTARGMDREELAKSLKGNGEFIGWGTQVRGLDLKAAMAARTFHTGTAQWPSAEGTFAINAREIRITDLRLKDGSTDMFAEGTIDFSHALDLQVRAPGPASGLGMRPARSVHLTGTLEAPRLERVIPKVEAKPASN
ncbi:MAG TPA: AsmA-like C-terminal region-containing protein [Candidatus Dormibacteraeota bacterium]|nr:AsmA-like C-terminal region-containing protein [Candidatus Dormibacteraeota bacterium]